MALFAYQAIFDICAPYDRDWYFRPVGFGLFIIFSEMGDAHSFDIWALKA